VFVGALAAGVKDFGDAQNAFDFGGFFSSPLTRAFVDAVAEFAQSG